MAYTDIRKMEVNFGSIANHDKKTTYLGLQAQFASFQLDPFLDSLVQKTYARFPSSYTYLYDPYVLLQ